jgi:nucleoside-diphosphate-sugar epimerase
MKKLLITGAGGFLGSHLVEIASASYEVYRLFIG